MRVEFSCCLLWAQRGLPPKTSRLPSPFVLAALFMTRLRAAWPSLWTLWVLGFLWTAGAESSPGKMAPPPAPEPEPTRVEAETPPPRPFEFSQVEAKASELAKQNFVRDDGGLPDFLGQISPEHYQEIRYKPEKSIWREEGLPFQIQAFHRGYQFRDRVMINLVDHGSTSRLGYSPDLFDYGHNSFPSPLPEDLGFAGLRFHYPLKRDGVFEDFAVFLGASYFRAVGLGQVYGLSARGLAIDTGLAKAEEFPVFREFWVERPEPDADRLVVHALLDSPSVTGAYRFVLHPGLYLTLDVQSHLYFRKKVERLGIAPLTSMFLRGENTDRFVDDVRPEVHDSDGLLIGKNTGEWIWRPLNNPRQLRISVFQDRKPSGFGLMSRDHQFDHYQDIDAQYQLRPGAWVEPLGDWGGGAVHLIEIPSDAEKYDNVVAFWVPEDPALPGKDWRYDYRLHFVEEEFTAPSSGKVVATRVGRVEGQPGRRRFMVDFTSPILRLMSPNAQIIGEVSAAGQLEEIRVRKNPHDGSWRLTFDLLPEKGRNPTELRAILRAGRDILTESWVYQWNAP